MGDTPPGGADGRVDAVRETEPSLATLAVVLRRVDLDELAVTMVEAYRDQIEAYSRLPRKLLYGRKLEFARANLDLFVRLAEEQRSITEVDIDGPRKAALFDVQDGIPLEGVLQAYQIGGALAWRTIADAARPEEHATGLLAATHLYVSFSERAAAAVCEVYAEELERCDAGAGRAELAAFEALVGGQSVVALDRTTTTTQTVAEPVRELVVKSGGGAVHLVPTSERLEVRQTQHYVLGKPKVKLAVKHGVLTLESDCSAKLLKCYAHLRVALPAGVTVSVAAQSGDVDAREINVPSVHVQSDSGDVSLGRIGRQRLVWARAGSGHLDVIAADARAVDARTDSGDVAVDVFRRAARRVVAHSHSGLVQVLARKGDYAINARTNSGELKIDGLTRDARAANSIDAQSDSGDIALNAR